MLRLASGAGLIGINMARFGAPSGFVRDSKDSPVPVQITFRPAAHHLRFEQAGESVLRADA
jgi:hypothetical protein